MHVHVRKWENVFSYYVLIWNPIWKWKCDMILITQKKINQIENIFQIQFGFWRKRKNWRTVFSFCSWLMEKYEIKCVNKQGDRTGQSRNYVFLVNSSVKYWKYLSAQLNYKLKYTQCENIPLLDIFLVATWQAPRNPSTTNYRRRQ